MEEMDVYRNSDDELLATILRDGKFWGEYQRRCSPLFTWPKGTATAGECLTKEERLKHNIQPDTIVYLE